MADRNTPTGVRGGGYGQPEAPRPEYAPYGNPATTNQTNWDPPVDSSKNPSGGGGGGVGLPVTGTTAAAAGTTAAGAGAAGSSWLTGLFPALAALGSGGMSLIGSIMAANAQQAAIQKAMDLQKGIHDQTRADLLPYMQGGQQTLGQLLAGLGDGSFNTQINPQNLVNDPGYQFRMQQAQQALERSAAARGGLNSGAFMKSLDRYSQGLASDEYNQAFGRQQSENQARFGRLFDTSRMGQNAAAGVGTGAANYANSQSYLYGAMGNAQAAAASAWPSAGGRVLGSMYPYLSQQGALGSGGSDANNYSPGSPSAVSNYDNHPGAYNIPTQDGGY